MDERLKVMAGRLPEVMTALSGLHSEVIKDEVLSARTKELMIVGIAVALCCEYRLRKHVPEAVKLGAIREKNSGGCKYCHNDGWWACSSLQVGSCS